MTIELSVSAVREALEATTGEASDGLAPTRLLSRVFGEVFAELIGLDSSRNAFRLVLGLERDRDAWAERLMDECYRLSIGPRLSRHQGHLQGATVALLEFWRGTQNLIVWLTELAWNAIKSGAPTDWEALTARFRLEANAGCELRQSGWSDTVRLTGIDGGLLKMPDNGVLCAVELGIAQSAPGMALERAALCRLIGPQRGAVLPKIGVVRFAPDRAELLFGEQEIAEAESRVFAVIAGLTGVGRSVKRDENAPIGEHAALAKRLAEAFREYGKTVEIDERPLVGPRFLRFEAKLGKAVRYDQMRGLTAEIGLRLGMPKDPIVSRSGGKLTIDLARTDPESIPFARVAIELGAKDELHGSPRLLVGVGIDGRSRFANLSDPINAHVLVAGTTGSGKTEWLRSAIASLLIANTPSSLRLVLMDPKQTAFGELKESPFLWSPHGFWVPGTKVGAGEVLHALELEMECRYKLLGEACVDDLRRYIEKTRNAVPRIVLICDEYYALLGQANKDERKEIERVVGMIGAKARAAGIHLVLAMQQASRKVIQGSIDTNIPCRVALMTSNAIESRMVIQADGADQLTGYGDLLYKDIGDPVRLQAPLLEPGERLRLFSSNGAR